MWSKGSPSGTPQPGQRRVDRGGGRSWLQFSQLGLASYPKRRVAQISEREAMKLPRRQFLHLAAGVADSGCLADRAGAIRRVQLR